MTDMQDILKMVREGRLTEATDSIQRRLGGGTSTAEAEPEMKDVTPRARTLPSPEPKPRPKTAKARKPRVRPKPTSRVRGGEPSLPEGGTWEARTGALPYRLFTPATPVTDAPLIVMLHGCTQSPEDFAKGTSMLRAADAVGAYVAFPEQSRTANANLCWNWFEPNHQGQSGEAAAILTIVDDLLAELGDRPVHVAGLSAGGAMAAILGARYGDRIASVGIHSGLPVGSARDVGSAFGAMRSGGTARVPLTVPAIVFHGTADRTVAPANGRAFLSGGVAADARTMGGRRVTVTRADAPQPVELWEVEGLGHAWSGGDAAGSYADPLGPDASAEMVRFFQRHN